MERPEEIIMKLNQLLDSDQFNQIKFDFLISLIMEKYHPEIKLLDFKYYNDYRRRLAKKEKIKCIKVQDFEKAARLRELEKECQNYISLRDEYRIDKSKFYFDQGYLFYFYLSNAKNDKIIKKHMNELLKRR